MSQSSGSQRLSRENSLQSFHGSCVADEHWVRPSFPVDSHTMKLSIIDQCEVRCWSSYVLCFKLGSGECSWQTYKHLCEGLSHTLYQFPFLAGRISFKDQVKGTLQLEVGPDPAVRFDYRDLSQPDDHDLPPLARYDRLRAEKFPPSTLETLEVAPPPQLYPVEGSPVFIAQANFVRGGLLLFFAHSHQVADATGTGSIMRTWSRNTAEAARGSPPTISTELRDASVDRSRLDEGLEDLSVPETSWATKKDEPLSCTASSWRHELSIAQCQKNQNTSIMWYVGPECLKLLKKLAYPPNDGNERWVSTGDALTALLWRQISKARRLHETDIDKTTLYFVCDVRSRLSPPLRSDSVCNATMKLFASQSPKGFQLELSTSLQQAAYQIRQAICGFTPARYQRWIGFLQSASTLSSLKPRERLNGGPDMVVTDHSKVSAYSFEWGPLGKIDCMRKLWWARSEAYSQCTIMPRLPDEGLEILTNFEEEINERLKGDREFSEFIQYRCQ
jgi:hypothetical protein